MAAVFAEGQADDFAMLGETGGVDNQVNLRKLFVALPEAGHRAVRARAYDIAPQALEDLRAYLMHLVYNERDRLLAERRKASAG